MKDLFFLDNRGKRKHNNIRTPSNYNKKHKEPKMKRLFLILMCLIALTALVSCSGGEAPVTDTAAQSGGQTDAPSDPADLGKLIINEEGTKYCFIVPDGAKTLYSACLDAKGEIFGVTSKNLFVKYTSSAEPGEYEIIVGLTDRAESAKVGEGLASDEYRIKWEGDKLVIAGGTNYSAKQGLIWFVNTYVKGASDKAVYVPEDIDQKGKANVNLEFKNLKSGWNSLVYPSSDGTELLYQIYMPANYDASKEYPCILYMHSAGVRCDDNSHIYTGEAKFLRNFEKSEYAKETIVIAPCCPKTEKWIPAATWQEITYDFVNTKPTTYMKAATELFSAAREKLSIDDSRLYLYGMSMGAFATWDLLARNPDTFAAAIPVAGAGDPSVASKLGKTAIWIFHGTADATVPAASGQAMYDALSAAGRTDIKYTLFEGAGHGIWSMTADTEGLFDWLFAQKRS